MMGERGMWFKQHFFEWAAKVPLVVSWPKNWKPSRVKQNVSLIDLMPTFLDVASDGKFNDYIDDIDGNSLLAPLQGNTNDMSDVVISEFAADGSTGPSRMVKKGDWKYMYLEGVETLLYNLKDDPKELNNLSGHADYEAIENELAAIALNNWDPKQWYGTIAQDQKRRLKIHSVTGGDPTYVHKIRDDDGERYIRNAGAADTKARARLPYVTPAKPN
jgi:choline-sulfatase